MMDLHFDFENSDYRMLGLPRTPGGTSLSYLGSESSTTPYEPLRTQASNILHEKKMHARQGGNGDGNLSPIEIMLIAGGSAVSVRISLSRFQETVNLWGRNPPPFMLVFLSRPLEALLHSFPHLVNA
jgi:hypothetical protein